MYNTIASALFNGIIRSDCIESLFECICQFRDGQLFGFLGMPSRDFELIKDRGTDVF